MQILHSIKQYFDSVFNSKSLAKVSGKNHLIPIHDSIPPSELLSLVGAGDYKAVGDIFFKYFVELGDLKPTDRVLDIGCGAGRMAMPLIDYLDITGSYEGFDIVKDAIDWCSKEISAKYPNFNFQLIDAYSKYYNPTGKYKSNEYIFPFKNSSFDFVFLTSVFTHMLPDDMIQYLSEISRVLKPNGSCLITYFLLNEQSLAGIQHQRSTFKLDHALEGCRIENVDIPEVVVAFDELKVNNLFTLNHLKIDSTHYGSWSGRKDFLSFQDIIVARKVNDI